MAKVAPGAAPFVNRRLGKGPGPSREGSQVAVRAGDPKKDRDSSASRPILLLLLGTLCGGLVLTYRHDHPTEPILAPEFANLFATCFAGIGVVMALWIGTSVVRSLRAHRILTTALAMSARGDTVHAETLFERVRRGDSQLPAAGALLCLAGAAARRGEHEVCLGLCNAGLGRLATPALRAAASDMIVPGLRGERDIALAILDRSDDAEATLALIPKDHFVYPGTAVAIRLIVLSRQGRLEEAFALAAAAPEDVHLSRQIELLLDLVKAVAEPSSADPGEVARLHDDLRTWPEGRHWMAIVAPAVLRLFEGEGSPQVAALDDEAAAVEEAAALDPGDHPTGTRSAALRELGAPGT